MKKSFIVLLLIGCVVVCNATAPNDYYNEAIGKSGSELQAALAAIIAHSDPGYDKLWSIYETTDRKEDGTVWDIYSGTTSYTFDDRCGSYSSEGDCFNREHTVPKSWRDGKNYSDVFMVLPTDGYVNGRRGNYAFGEVGTSSYVSDNGFSKLGTCITSGYSGTVFEPNDEYKGDIARIYFYAATRYCNECGEWSGEGFDASFPHLNTWTCEMMLRWHQSDPVSLKEENRNDAVFATSQGNRNPFVDYPELVDLIFGDDTTTPFFPEGAVEEFVALDATDINDTSFTARWIQHSRATDYELAVWQVEQGDATQQTLFDVTFASGLPADWSKAGYTSVENGALRMASGSQNGEVSTPALDLSKPSTITITCAPYKTSDQSVLYILVDGVEVSQINCADGEVTESVVLDVATKQSVITLRAMSSHRLYLKTATLVAGDQESIIMHDGYPRRTGGVTQYVVEDVTPQATYYYKLTAYDGTTKLAETNEICVVMKSSAVHSVQRNLPEGSYIYAHNSAIYIDGVQPNTQVCCYALDGALRFVRTVHAQRESITIDRGVYIVQLITGERCYTKKIVVN